MYGWAQQLAAASNIQLGGGLNAVPLVSYGMYHSVPMAAPMPAPGVVPIGAAQPGPAAGAVPIGSGGGERGSVGERTITIVDPASNGTEGQSSAPAPDSSSVPIGVDNNNVVVANVELLKRARSMKEIGPESDFVQRILGFLRVVVDTYSIVISSLLSVFVPQFCDIKEEYKFCVEENPNDPSCDTHICRMQPLTLVCRQHECTAKENFEDLVPYNKFVLAWNFIALAVALVHYRIVWLREKWLIRYLDVSPIHSRVNLRHVIKYYPELEEGLSVQNRRTMISSIVWLIVAVINVIVSAILVFKFYYNNERTVTTFITSVLIIGQLSYQSLEITMLGLRHQVALSCLQFEPISFNIIDKDYKGKPDPTRMASGVSAVDAANQQPAGQ